MRIFVENLQFTGRHGVYEEERRDGRLFRVDVAAHVPTFDDDDDIENTLDYRRLVNIVLEVGLGDSKRLVETLARAILDRIFSGYTAVERIELTIRKKATGVAGDPEWVGVGFDLARADWDRAGD